MSRSGSWLWCSSHAPGSGRETKDSVIDLAVGIELKVGEGDYVGEGSVLAEIYANDQQRLTEALQTGLGAFRIGDEKPPQDPLFTGRSLQKTYNEPPAPYLL